MMIPHFLSPLLTMAPLKLTRPSTNSHGLVWSPDYNVHEIIWLICDIVALFVVFVCNLILIWKEHYDYNSIQKVQTTKFRYN